jgi:GrpB-like predicted nucleotidyltransferase (UPF0157 family)
MTEQFNEVTIVDYNPAWPAMFAEEKTRLLNVAGTWIEDVQHVGSTSVQDLAAKPIIDIMIAIYDLADVEKCVAPIESLGYGYMGEYGLPERHFFRKPPPDGWIGRTHHIHMVLRDSNQWINQIHFRDYLRAYPEARQQYQDLKRELATQFGSDRFAYTDAKQEFIFAILRKAGYPDERDALAKE